MSSIDFSFGFVRLATPGLAEAPGRSFPFDRFDRLTEDIMNERKIMIAKTEHLTIDGHILCS